MKRLLTALVVAVLAAVIVPAAAKSPTKPADARKAATAAADAATSRTESSSTHKSASTTDSDAAISEEIRKADAKADTSADNVALIVEITGSMRERGETIILLSKRTKSLKDYLDLLRKARDDKNVRTVVLRIAAVDFDLATAQELRVAIGEVRTKGKKTIAVLEDDGQSAYLVAAACEQIVMPSSADIMLKGVSADAYFLRSLLSKLGVEAQVLHVGQYKSFGEMFTEDDFTTPARQNMTELVDDLYSQMTSTVAESRNIPGADVEAAIDRGPIGAPDAKAAGLIDRVAYGGEVYKDLEKAGQKVYTSDDYYKGGRDKADEVNLLSLFAMINKGTAATADEKPSKYPQVAVVYAVGPISLGPSQGIGFSDEEEIASDDIIQTLDEIQNDRKIKAVILRVNSPGGSAFASDLIWKKLKELRAVKPVVASMSDVAASGGYYISMGATKIVAHEGTITGSIGVVGGKVNIGAGLKKLGINKTSVARGKFSNLFSETDNFSPAERELVQRMMLRTYDEFVTKAAEGRNLSKEAVEKVAQGRVWTGQQAKAVGLVDEIGGLAKAVTETKTLLGLKKDDKVALIAYPKETTLLELLQKAIGGGTTARAPGMSLALPEAVAALMPREAHNLLTTARTLVRLFDRERVLAIMPFVPVIR